MSETAEVTDEMVENMSDEEYEAFVRTLIPPNVGQVFLGEAEDRMITFTTYDNDTHDQHSNVKKLFTLGEISAYGDDLEKCAIPYQAIAFENIPPQLGGIISEVCEMYENTSVILRFWELLDTESDGKQWHPVFFEFEY
jgi:hypothetical protein